MTSTTAVVPGILSVPRITTLIASLLVALSSGTNYVRLQKGDNVQKLIFFGTGLFGFSQLDLSRITACETSKGLGMVVILYLVAYVCFCTSSVYSPQLGSRLHISHTQLNVVGLAGNAGVYGTGPLWGRIVDTRGPRILLAGAFVSLLVGYSGIRYLYNAAEDSVSTSQLSFCALVLFSFMTGVGGNAGLSSAVNSTAKTFPDRRHATTTGLVFSGFGLSAFFFSVIAHVAFGGDVSSLLLLLSLGTSIPMILGFFLVRPIPLPGYESTRNVQYGVLDDEGDDIPAVAPAVLATDSQTPLLSSHGDKDDEDDSYNDDDDAVAGISTSTPRYVVPVTPHAVELSPTRSVFSNGSRHRSDSSISSRIRGRVNVAADEPPNIHGLALALSGDFWIMTIILSLLCGTGLMYINNIGSMSVALLAHGNRDYSEEQASRWQAAQVSTLSITNFLGRIVIGLTSDFAKNQLHLPRTYCIPLVASLFVVSQISATMIDDVHHLWWATALLGLAYGSVFGLFPTATIEMFGLAHFSENWGYMSLSPVLGGNVFSVAFGRILDGHAPSDADVTSRLASSTESQCLEGRHCYIDALYMTIAACILALILGVWVGWRERRKMLARTSESVSRKNVVWHSRD